MTVVDGIRFDFEAPWSHEKWDDHAAYRGGIGKLQQTRAVDLIGRLKGTVAFIEVKDFRHADADWHRVTDGSLAEEVAHKVRDTIAGLVGASRRRPDEGWKAWPDAMLAEERVVVVLWLERSAAFQQDPRRRDELQHFRDVLKRKLSWLTSDVFICGQGEAVRLPGVSASDA